MDEARENGHKLICFLLWRAGAGKTLILSTDHLITSERFPKHCDKRPVSRQKHGVCWLVRFSPPSCNIQPNQCLACSRHAGDKADELVPVFSRLVHQLLNTPGGDPQILCPSIMAGDGFD